MRKRIFLFLLIFIVLGGSVVAWFGYRMVMASNYSGKTKVFFVDENTEVEDIVYYLDSALIDPATFIEWAHFQKLEHHMKPGRYAFSEGMSNRVMINRLKGGLQSPTRVQFHNVRDFNVLAGKLSKDLQPDSLAFIHALNSDSIWNLYEVSKANRFAYIIPNTYEFYWNSSAEDVVVRLIEERNRFWNEERVKKAEEQGLTPIEVSTLATIVAGETYMHDEMPMVAGLYLNRINKGMLLQCDATSKYAWEQVHPEDYPVRRVLYKMTELDHPYNTYVNRGLPPGPIAIPELVAIEAVLNPEQHAYIFMMVDPDKPGYHAFAKTNAQHLRNVQKYRESRR